jgi:hypothetical protein
MSVTQKVLQKLQKALPETRLCKDVLVITPMDRILRGFMFERTIEKGRYYFWYVVIPLYSPLDFFALNSSKRFRDFVLTAANCDDVTSQIHQIILDGHLELLRGVRTPKDFLAFSKRSEGRVEVYEGLTHYVLGNVGRCKNSLRKTVERLRSSSDSKASDVRELINFFDELDSRPESATRRIKRWEKASIETFGLASAMSADNSQQ